MKVISSKPKKQRILKSVYYKMDFGIHKGKKLKRPFSISPIGSNWWFCIKDGQWQQGYNGTGGMTSTYYAMTKDGFKDAYSLKAVIRLIRNWDVPKGTKFTARLPFVGYDFTITK